MIMLMMVVIIILMMMLWVYRQQIRQSWTAYQQGNKLLLQLRQRRCVMIIMTLMIPITSMMMSTLNGLAIMAIFAVATAKIGHIICHIFIFCGSACNFVGFEDSFALCGR